MASVHVHCGSFNAGLLSPLLRARFNVEKVDSGCRQLRNFIPHVHGPVFRRPGMEDMGQAAGNSDPSCLRAFKFSTTTAAILELHPSGLKVWQNGTLVPLENDVELPYSASECSEVQMEQVNDVCYLTHRNHPPLKLVRYTDTRWQIGEPAWKWPAMGDENVRKDEIASPSVTTLLTVETLDWPEFEAVAGETVELSVTNPDLGTQQKTARIERFYQGAWSTVASLAWTGVAPSEDSYTFGNDRAYRIVYLGPIAAGCEIVASGASATHTLDASAFQPVSGEPVTVPAGDWQAVVTCPAEVPSGATLHVQKRVGNGWVNLKKLVLKAGETTTYRGVKLTADTIMRFAWAGRAMPGGTAKLESIGFTTSAELTLAVDVVNGKDRTMTASAPIFTPGHVGSYWQITHRREEAFVQLITGASTIVAATSSAIRVSGRWDFFSYGIWNATVLIEKKINGVWEAMRSYTGRKDRNVVASGEEPEPVELRIRVTSGTAESASGAASPRFVLECAESRVDGLVKVTAIGPLTNGKADTATVDVVSDLYSTAATPIWTEGAWSVERGFPCAVAIHGGRLWFAGAKSEPSRVWGSAINDFENFRRSSFDDASVSFSPASQSANRAQWLASHGDELIMGTTGDEWTISGGPDRAPITPTNVNFQRRSSYGSMAIQPLVLGEVLVFVQRGGLKLRQVAPRSDLTAWAAPDLTVLAGQITKSGVRQTACMMFPQTILWAVTNDGRLIGMTFEQDQNVFAWHEHVTDGSIESVAVIPGANCDEVWVAVRRNGVRRIERIDPLTFAGDFSEPNRLMFLDSAKRFRFESARADVEGLGHLESRVVRVIGDGAELCPATVINGRIVLERACKDVVIGLPYVSTLQRMRIDVPMQDGTAQARKFKLARLAVDVQDSGPWDVADGEGNPSRSNARRASTPMGSAAPLFSGEMEFALESTTRSGVDAVVSASGGFPLCVVGMVYKLDIYGE